MLRPYTAADRAVYLQLAHDFYRSEAVAHTIPDSHLARTADALETGTPFAAAYMLESDGQIAGYALLALTWSQEGGGLAVWVEELYVLPQFRGQGLGTAFFADLQRLYPNAARFRLEIEPDNERARALYEKIGFQLLIYQQMVMDTD